MERIDDVLSVGIFSRENIWHQLCCRSFYQTVNIGTQLWKLGQICGVSFLVLLGSLHLLIIGHLFTLHQQLLLLDQESSNVHIQSVEFLFEFVDLNWLADKFDVMVHTLFVLAQLFAKNSTGLRRFKLLTNAQKVLQGIVASFYGQLYHPQHLIRFKLTRQF